MIVEKMPKNAEKYYCKLCDFGCSKQSNYDNHISTRKHKMIVNDSKMIVKKCQNKYACICGKSYKHDSGYYRHKKTCTFVEEKEEEKKLPMDEMEDEGTAVSYSEGAKPDFADIDGDGDKKETMKQAAKDKKKKVKKESIDSKLAEIGKEAEKVKMEAQLDFLHDHINEKVNRVNSIQEDENLSELIDKSKMKQMQREIKDLERRKAKMERIYEKSCGSKYAKKEMVDEMDAVSWNEKNNPTRNRAVGERDPKKVGKSTSAYAINEAMETASVYEIPKDAPESALKPYIGKFLQPTNSIKKGTGDKMVSSAREYKKEGGLFKYGPKDIELSPPVGLSSFGKPIGKPEKAKDDNEKPAEYRDESGKKIKNKDFNIRKVSYKLVK